MELGGQKYIFLGSLSSVLNTSYIGSLYSEGWILSTVDLLETEFITPELVYLS